MFNEYICNNIRLIITHTVWGRKYIYIYTHTIVNDKKWMLDGYSHRVHPTTSFTRIIQNERESTKIRGEKIYNEMPKF